jgi:hypothetical protein
MDKQNQQKHAVIDTGVTVVIDNKDTKGLKAPTMGLSGDALW